MKNLNEFIDLCNYGNYLNENDFNLYANHLSRKVLKEMTIGRFAKALQKIVFDKLVTKDFGTTLGAIQKLRKASQNYKYDYDNVRKVFRPNGYTHLETEPGKYCNKKVFRDSLLKQNFKLPKYAAGSAVQAAIDELLKAFYDNGWLISVTDIENAKKIEALDKWDLQV